MISWPAAFAIAVFPAAVVAIIWVATRHHRARWRRGVRAVERAAARVAIKREYDEQLANVQRRLDTALQEATTARQKRDVAAAQATAAAAKLRRIDLVADDLYRSGQYIPARRIMAELRDSTPSEVRPGEQVDRAVGE